MLKWLLLASFVLLAISPVMGVPSVGTISCPAGTGMYEKFECSFSITTSAANLFWPYDPDPAANTPEHPHAVPAGVGVSVDGLFLPPGETNWAEAVIQPAFLYQDYQVDFARTLSNGTTWTHPVGPPLWKIRFAPNALGTWRLKVRITDVNGTAQSSEHQFECTQSGLHGFVRVSPTDKRYFELSDGTFQDFIGAHTLTAAQAKDLGVNLVRVWWQSSNPSRALFGAGGQGGDGVWANLHYDVANAPDGYLTCSTVPQNAAIWDSINSIVAVKPNTAYCFKARVKLASLTGDGDCGLFLGAFSNTDLKSSKSTGSMDWTWVSLNFNPGNRYEARVWISTQNTTAGVAYVSDVSLREDLGGGLYGPELLGRTDLQAHRSYHPFLAWSIDQDLIAAEQNGIYLRVVAEEKGDSFFGRVKADGSWGAFSSDNVYASATHACRTYQTYYWRYLLARFGYSRSIHSFELFNEADPFSGNHWNSVQAFCQYVKDHDPHKHLASTSNWHSFPILNWKQCTAADYLDMHMYMGWNVPSGGMRVFPGWDGPWYCANWVDFSDTTSTCAYQIDSTVKRSGRNSLKITMLPGAAFSETYLRLGFVCGAPPGHTMKVSAWVRGQNVMTFQGHPEGAYLHGLYKQDGDDWCGWPTAGISCRAGTYDWERVEATFVVPATLEPGKSGIPQSIYYRPRVRPNNSAQPGYVWMDDIVVEDVTTGRVVNYNGGFEEITPESYDVVADHCSYAKLLSGFQLDKPATRSETGMCHTQRYADPYKGFYKNEEDEALIDDTEHVWWRKLVWSQISSDKLYEFQWWSRNIGGSSGRAYQEFMAGIPLSNGRYVDAAATPSSPDIRVLGQKDLTDAKAHIWIDNRPYTWKSVVDHNYSPETWSSSATYATGSTCGSGIPTRIYKSLQNGNKDHAVTDSAWWQDMGAFNPADNPPLPPPISGNVTISGLKDGKYKVEWWNTSVGGLIKAEEITCSDGNLVLAVQNLQSDVACKMSPVDAEMDLRVTVPAPSVIPGQTLTVTVTYTNSGEAEARNVSVRARVPAEMTYVAGSAEATGGTYDADSQFITWLIASVPGQGTGTRTFQATVK